jgi:hypothetical protein
MTLQKTSEHSTRTDINGTVIGITESWLVSGAAQCDDRSVIKAVIDAAPHVCGEAVLENAAVIEDAGAGIRKVELVYKRPDGGSHSATYAAKRHKRRGDRIWSFDTKERWGKCKRGIALVQAVSAYNINPGLRIDWDGAENIGNDGVEFISCRMQEKCVATFDAGEIDSTFKRTIIKLIGTVNRYSFHGWEPGEVLFLGAEEEPAYRNNSGKWLCDVTFRFAISPNEYAPGFGGYFFKGRVEGWDHKWAVWGREMNKSSFSSLLKGIFLTRLYKRSDFGALKINSKSNEKEQRERLYQQNRTESSRSL